MMGYRNPGAEMKLTMPVMEDHADCRGFRFSMLVTPWHVYSGA